MEKLSEKCETKITRRMGSVYHTYLNSYYTSLYDCYSNPSCYKESAWEDCEDLRREYHGSQLRVIGYSCHAFSAGFVAEEDGEEYFVYITKDYTRCFPTALLY